MLFSLFLSMFLETSLYAYADFLECVILDKPFKKWQKTLLIIFCFLIFILSIFTLVVGAILSFDNQFRKLGNKLTVIGIIFVITHLIITLIAYFSKKLDFNEDVTSKTEEDFIMEYEENTIENPSPIINYIDE